jgi:mono/diheme cytochrome c family protein
MTRTRAVTRRRGRLPGVAVLAPILALVAACGGGPGGSGTRDGGRAAVLSPAEARAGRAVAPARVAEGRRVYTLYCAGCHGDQGDGKGPAAPFLDPKPRDFTQGVFKFGSVPAGGLPRDEDLMRTLVRGLPGSSMPAWPLLPEGERRAVIAYLKTLSPAWSERAPAAPVAVSEDPFDARDAASLQEAIDRGRVVYHVHATCWQCHAAYATRAEIDAMAAAEGSAVDLRADASRPTPVEDAWGATIVPTEFTAQRLKNGSAVVDLYRTIATGIGGTAMPTWKDALEERDLWALAYYVKSLSDRRWGRVSPVPSLPAAGGR